MQYVILFTSYYFADKADKVLIEERISHELIATPLEIDDACGMAIRIDMPILEKVLMVLTAHNISRSGIYTYEKGKSSERIP